MPLLVAGQSRSARALDARFYAHTPPPLQPLVLRQKDKTVLLPGDTAVPGGEAIEEEGPAPTIFEDLDDGSLGSKGRVTIYCISGAVRARARRSICGRDLLDVGTGTAAAGAGAARGL